MRKDVVTMKTLALDNWNARACFNNMLGSVRPDYAPTSTIIGLGEDLYQEKKHENCITGRPNCHGPN